MTGCVVGAAVVGQVQERTSNVDMREESLVLKVDLEYMQDE